MLMNSNTHNLESQGNPSEKWCQKVVNPCYLTAYAHMAIDNIFIVESGHNSLGSFSIHMETGFKGNFFTTIYFIAMILN